MGKVKAAESNGVVVESGVEMPPRNSGSRGRKYPWDEMASGDSFVVDRDRRHAVMSSARFWLERSGRKAEGWRVATRQEGDGERVRVWLWAGE